MLKPSSANENFTLTIKQLTQTAMLFESRFFECYTLDLYRLEDKESDTGFFWFTVRRGDYARIDWLTWEQAGDFIANSVIDEIIREERQGKL